MFNETQILPDTLWTIGISQQKSRCQEYKYFQEYLRTAIHSGQIQLPSKDKYKYYYEPWMTKDFLKLAKKK